jgi:hypothetical protein
MTLPRQPVLRVILAEPSPEMCELQISQAFELSSGIVPPGHARLETRGWLENHWTDIGPAEEGRPRHRYYSLNLGSVRPRPGSAQ